MPDALPRDDERNQEEIREVHKKILMFILTASYNSENERLINQYLLKIPAIYFKVRYALNASCLSRDASDVEFNFNPDRHL